MAWDVEYTDDFGRWWADLSEEEQESVAAYVELLEERGPHLIGGTSGSFPSPMTSTTGT